MCIEAGSSLGLHGCHGRLGAAHAVPDLQDSQVSRASQEEPAAVLDGRLQQRVDRQALLQRARLRHLLHRQLLARVPESHGLITD